MKKTLSKLLLIAIMANLASCGGTATTDTTAADTTVPVTEEVHLRDTIPEKDFGGAEFFILAATDHQNKYDSEETGDILDDAVFKLNRDVEERFHVEIKFQFEAGTSKGHPAVTKALNNSVLSGDATYDMTVINTAYVSQWILNGIFTNLADMEHLNFDDPWWYRNVNNKFAVDDTIYAVSGAYALNAVSDGWAMMINRELLDSLKLEDPYSYVFDGTWTFDRWQTMCMAAYSDINGDTKYSNADRFGVVSPGNGMFNALPFGMGRKIMETGSDGYPQFVGAPQHTVDIMEKLAVLDKNRAVYFSCKDVPEMINMFCQGQALSIVYPMHIIEMEEMRAAPDYGILPLPKFDEKQESYQTYCFMDAYQIPRVVKDEEMSQMILNALNCYAYYDVVGMYKEKMLQTKLSRDENSSEVIDLLIDGIVTDFGCLFMGQLDSRLFYCYEIFRSGSYTTWWAKQETALGEKLSKLIADLNELAE
ncbi:MAG: hypothetical protein E7632_06650 [Ruminococcaceae bacterium]|nr:hypothetical protein [Oscillospiraceae bacterium]